MLTHARYIFDRKIQSWSYIGVTVLVLCITRLKLGRARINRGLCDCESKRAILIVTKQKDEASGGRRDGLLILLRILSRIITMRRVLQCGAGVYLRK